MQLPHIWEGGLHPSQLSGKMIQKKERKRISSKNEIYVGWATWVDVGCGQMLRGIFVCIYKRPLFNVSRPLRDQ